MSHDQKCTGWPQNLFFFMRNIYAAKMQSFINQGRKIIFFKFCDVTVTL